MVTITDFLEIDEYGRESYLGILLWEHVGCSLIKQYAHSKSVRSYLLQSYVSISPYRSSKKAYIFLDFSISIFALQGHGYWSLKIRFFMILFFLGVIDSFEEFFPAHSTNCIFFIHSWLFHCWNFQVEGGNRFILRFNMHPHECDNGE